MLSSPLKLVACMGLKHVPQVHVCKFFNTFESIVGKCSIGGWVSNLPPLRPMSIFVREFCHCQPCLLSAQLIVDCYWNFHRCHNNAKMLLIKSCGGVMNCKSFKIPGRLSINAAHCGFSSFLKQIQTPQPSSLDAYLTYICGKGK